MGAGNGLALPLAAVPLDPLDFFEQPASTSSAIGIHVAPARLGPRRARVDRERAITG